MQEAEMVTPVNDLTRDTKSGTAGRSGAGGEPDESTLAELRKSVNALAEELAQIAEKRGRQVKEQAEAGVTEVRKAIRRQPALAMGCAALAGAVLAILLVPSRPSRPASRWTVPRWDSWAPGWMPSLTRADLYDAMDSVQRSVSRAASAAPGTFERLLEAITRVDPQASFGSTVEKAGSWLERMQSKVKK
jgi:hypothetical protein